MWPVTPELLEVVKGSARIARRISILNSDLETVLANVKVTAFPVRVNPSISRRAGSVSCVITPAIRELLDGRHPWRREDGVWIPSKQAFEWVPTFTGWPDEDVEDWLLSGSVVEMPLRGRERLADKAGFEDPVYWAKGTRLGVMVRDCCEMAGMGTDPDLYRFDDGGRVLTVDHGYEEDVHILSTVDQVTRDNALDFACDPESVNVLRAIPNLETAPVVATYRRGPLDAEVPLVKFTRKRIPNPLNAFTVVGTGGFQIVRSERRDEASIRATGLRPDKYTSAGIGTLAQCNEVCDARYATRGSMAIEIEVTAPPNPALDYLDVVELFEPSSRTAGRHFLQGFEIPDGLDAQVLTTREVRSMSGTALFDSDDVLSA